MYQAITWANVDPDLCHHMVSLNHNKLIWDSLRTTYNTNKAYWIKMVEAF